MANNLFITRAPTEADAAPITEAIGRFGDVVQLHATLWYLRTRHSSADVAEAIWRLMDPNDCLVVIDATNDATAWFNVKPEIAEQIETLSGRLSARPDSSRNRVPWGGG